MTLLALGHVTDDINQSFIAALLPALIISLHLSLASAGTLVFAQAISSSVVQPAIGHLADRRALPWLISVGLVLAGGGVALMGIAPTYPLVFAAALVSGLGVAMFHPEAARFANYVAGAKKATGMRWFTVGGNVGFAVGPVFATSALAAYGLHGTLLAALPVLVLAALIYVDLPRMRTFVPARRAAGTSPELRDDWTSFTKLSFFVVIRSMAYLGLVSFLPLYAVRVLHVSVPTGAALDTTYLIFGILGTVAGGPLADRFGRRAVMIASTAGAALLVFAFVAATRSAEAPLAVAFVFAAAIGFVLVASQVSFVVLGQEYLPNRLGIASGVTLGLAVSIGGMFSPVLGAIGDAHGLAATVATIAALCALALGFALTLPPRYVSSGKPRVASAS